MVLGAELSVRLLWCSALSWRYQLSSEAWSASCAATLTGSFVIEKVFNIPGLGQHFVNSVLNRDQTLILGIVMVYSAFVLVLNLAVDLLYGFVDPRIQIGGAK